MKPQHLTENIKLRLDSELYDALKDLAALGDRTVAGEMRRALRQHVEQARDDAETVRVLNEATP